MARLVEVNEAPLFKIENFLGLNLPKAGDTQIYKGESGNMYNCYVTKDYDLSKAEGYLQLTTQIANKSIQGMWQGDIGGTQYFLFAINGHLYKFNNNHWTDFDGTDTWNAVTTDLGTLTDAPTQFFSFNGKVYILNGYEYKSFDGSTFTDVAGYIPKITIGCKPSTGAGTPFEGLNLLTGKKHQTYNSDGTATYKLPETNIDSVDSVSVNGTLKTVTTHYTVNLTTGVVTFTAGNFPSSGGLDNVDIYWTKGTGNRDIVVKNRFAYLFGLASDTRVFMYGNKDEPHIRINSTLANGKPSVEYFVSANIDEIGSKSFTITHLEQQQDLLWTFKENESWIASQDIVNLDGIDYVNFPTKRVNSKRGNVAIGQGQLLDNEVFTIDNQFIKWYPTDIEDERNQKDMGSRIQKDLDGINLSKCLTIDKQNSSEMWISNGKKVWIYRYDLQNPFTKEKGVFSRLYLDDEPTCWLLIDGNLFFGTTTGRIMKISEKYLTYNGKAIDSHWEMNMFDFGRNNLVKNMIKGWIELAAQPKALVDVQYVTNKNAYGTVKTVTYNTATFNDVDFANFTFYTNYNPQTFSIRLRAVGFTTLKMVIDNTSATSTFALLSLTLKAEYGSEIR